MIQFLMNMLLYMTMSLFVAAYFYLIFSGLRLHQKLEQLQKNIEVTGRQGAINRLEYAYISKLHCALAGIEKTGQHNKSTGFGHPSLLNVPMSSEHVKNELVDFLHNFLRQYNDSFEANIKLDIVSGSCAVTYRDSLSVLRIIVQLAEKAKENKTGPISVFMLLIAPLQIAVEITKPANYDARLLRSIIETETLLSPTLHILQHETSDTFERLVIGAGKDDEDSSSRRSRDFQRKY